jgi:enterochelin esterase-like enzyme
VTAASSRYARAAAATLVGFLASCKGATDEVIGAGCFQFDAPYFTWTSYDSAGPHSGESAIIQLVASPNPDVSRRHPGGRALRVPGLTDSAQLHRRSLFSWWEPVTGGGIHLRWHNGFHGPAFDLTPRGDSLLGRYEQETDVGSPFDLLPKWMRTKPARAARVPCAQRLEEFVLYDSSYQRPRRIWVYTPSGYNANAATPYPLIVAFDGDEYRDTMPLPMALDSLIAAGRTPAFVAVLVDDSTSAVRIADLGNAARMPRFLGGQLLPWVRSRWRVTGDPHRVIVTGSSAGGLAAAYVALTRPDLFGNVWSQSGAFWRGAEASNGAPYEWLTTWVRAAPRADVRFVLDVGELEDHPTLGGSGPNFRDASRRFHDALLARGYDVTYTEVPGGNHAPQWWRERLAWGIAVLSAGWTVR